MIKSVTKKIILGSIIITSLAILIGTTQVNQIVAEESDEKKYTNANDIAIHTVFAISTQFIVTLRSASPHILMASSSPLSSALRNSV